MSPIVENKAEQIAVFQVRAFSDQGYPSGHSKGVSQFRARDEVHGSLTVSTHEGTTESDLGGE
jgi:hypothetical protein